MQQNKIVNVIKIMQKKRGIIMNGKELETTWFKQFSITCYITINILCWYIAILSHN